MDQPPSNPPEAPSVLDLLRSGAAVSLLSFVLLLVLMTVSAFTWNARTPVPLGLVVLNWCIAVPLIAVGFVVGNRVVASRYANRAAPLALVVIMTAVVTLAVIVPVTVEGAMGQQGLTLQFVVQRVVPSRLPVIPFYLLIVCVVGLRQWYASARSKALDQLVQTRAAGLVASGALAAALADAVADASGMSSGSRSEADEMLAHAMQSSDPGASAQAADAVRDAARNAVRTSSHRMWEGAPTAPESMPWRDILAVSMREHPLPLAAAAILAVLGCFVHASRVGGIRPPGALASAVIIVALMAVVFMAGRAAIRWRPPLAPFVTVGAVLLVVLVPFRIPGLVDPAIAGAVSGRGALYYLVTALALVIGTSVLLTARDSAGAVITGLQEARREAEVDRRVLDEATARLKRDVAQHVHGTVQPGLIAAAIAIDDAMAHGDRDSLHLALNDARNALDADFTPATAADGVSTADVLQNLRRQWVGMLDVQCADPVPVLQPELTATVKEVVKECLNNAYIHGGARHALVEIVAGPDGTTVVVTDDGSGPGGGAPGLGTAIMAQATRGEWTLTPADDGGAQVRAVLRAAQ